MTIKIVTKDELIERLFKATDGLNSGDIIQLIDTVNKIKEGKTDD